ncbi:MAG: apolipoprotein A1/A4/E family protein [Lachnospira sp.]|nr:apolipoprotein A1/A4/E family protein [Lachnospira sp.]
MAKKSWLKVLVGIGAVAVAGKVAYDKYKSVKEAYTQEENESVDDEVKKYNAVCQKKLVEVEDEEFTGCEIKTDLSSTVIDLGLATFEKDVYINFTSNMSGLTIILPEGVNVACDVNKTLSGVRNLVDNVDEEGINTVYIIGKATCSSIEIVPVNFYVEDEDIEGLEDEDFLFDDEDDFVDETVESPKSIMSKAKEVVEAVKEKATPVVESVKEKAAPVVESVKEKAAPVVESVKEKAAPVVESVKEKAAPVVESVKEKTAPVVENVEEKAGKAASRVRGLFGRGKKAAEEAVEEVEETVEDVVDAVEDKVEDAKDAVEEKVEELALEPEDQE